MAAKTRNRIKSITKIKHAKRFNSDKWLAEHFENLVDQYAGRYILVVDGKVVYTDKDGSPKQIAQKAKARFPHTVPLFFRVPRPHEFVCALTAG